MSEQPRDLVVRTFEFAKAVRTFVNDGEPGLETAKGRLVSEADELKRIFSAIAGKDDTQE